MASTRRYVAVPGDGNDPNVGRNYVAYLVVKQSARHGHRNIHLYLFDGREVDITLVSGIIDFTMIRKFFERNGCTVLDLDRLEEMKE